MPTVKEKPILFSGPMVKAILEGHKTQTRRIVKPQPYNDRGVMRWKPKKGYDINIEHLNQPLIEILCPYQVGMNLWVRETFLAGYAVGGAKNFGDDGNPIDDETIDVIYRADGEQKYVKWTPSIFMRREYSRINLEITGIRFERVQRITPYDALEEGGFEYVAMRQSNEEYDQSLIDWFSGMWDSTYGEGSFDLNKFVWVLEFKVI